MKQFFTSQFKTPLGFLEACADEDGFVVRIDIAENGTDEKKGDGKAARTLEAVRVQINEYFDGKRTNFDLPVSLDALLGTAFQKSVWKELLNISFGKTDSYGSLAVKIGKKNAVRAVGGAVGKNPLLIVIPCHRVLGKKGSLTGFSAGIGRKITLLELEKIPFVRDASATANTAKKS